MAIFTDTAYTHSLLGNTFSPSTSVDRVFFHPLGCASVGVIARMQHLCLTFPLPVWLRPFVIDLERGMSTKIIKFPYEKTHHVLRYTCEF
jgi:hypothetical protein